MCTTKRWSYLTYISPENTVLGLEECLTERFSRISNAVLASLIMIMVWPITVTELMGPSQ